MVAHEGHGAGPGRTHATILAYGCDRIAVTDTGYRGCMKVSVLAGAAVAAALGVRIAHPPPRRLLHPEGRSFTGGLETGGRPLPIGSALTDRAGRYPATVRISKGAGTAPGRADILGLAVRLHGPDGSEWDLLLSTAGAGRFTRHVPLPRRSFDTRYGSILA